MSYVTNVMLHYGLEDEGKLEEINALVAPLNNGQEFRDITSGPSVDLWGGHKYPEVNLVAAAFNYWDDDATKKALAGIEWERPDLIQLFICDQEDDAFSLYVLGTTKRWRRVYDGRDL